MINVISRLSGAGIFFLLAVVAGNALALTDKEIDDLVKNTKVYGSPVTDPREDPRINDKIHSCTKVGVKTIGSITELILNTGTDPDAAQEALKLPIDHVLLICGNARYLLENGKVKNPYLLDWVKQQELGWRTTRHAAGRAAMYIARFNHAVDVWKNNWVPKLREKKKKFREIGADISKDYNELLAMSQRGQFDDAFEAKLNRFRTTVNASKSLQMSLLDLQKFVLRDLKEGDPFDDINQEDINVVKMMAPIIKIDKTDHWWFDGAEVWNSKVIGSWGEMLLTYKKLQEQVESLRKQTLFRSHGKPLHGIKFTEIHPTFQRLYDELYKKGKNYAARAAAEERRWEEDRKVVDQYFDECGASAEKEQKLKAARTGTTATAVRDLKLESARGPSSASNERERRLKFARMLGSDVEKEFHEKGRANGKSEAEIEKEWDEFVEKTVKQEKAETEAAEEHDRKVYEEGIAVLEKQDEQAEKEYRKWEAECSKKRVVADKVMKDNAKRRKELGLPRKPVYGS